MSTRRTFPSGGVPPVAPAEEFDAETAANRTAVALDREAGQNRVGEDEHSNHLFTHQIQSAAMQNI